jgi:AcrR family transcriptional regulator
MDKWGETSEPSGMTDMPFRPGPKGPSVDTRKALLASFADLALSRRYGDFGVNSIVRAAKVARSTFYYHFASKDDLLLENLRPFIEELAAAPGNRTNSPALELWTAHIWQHRGVARRLLTGRTGEKLQASLTDSLHRKLTPECGEADQTTPFAIRAELIAGSTMTLLRAWVSHRFSATPEAVAAAIWDSARALSQFTGR